MKAVLRARDGHLACEHAVGHREGHLTILDADDVAFPHDATPAWAFGALEASRKAGI